MKQLQAFCKRAQACGFTSLMQVRVFLTVAEFPGETTAREVADATGIVAAQVLGVIRTLSDWGLVSLEKRKVLVDGCQQPRIFATLTPDGKAAADILQMEVAR